MNWFIVIGRIPFDDEDTAEVIQAASLEDAEKEFRSAMLAAGEPTEYEDGEPVIFINYVFKTETRPYCVQSGV